jgi:hypothetical protein
MGISVTPIPTLTEFGTPDLTLTTANAAGSTSVKTTLRTDASVLAYDATVPTTIAYGASAAAGDTATAARRNHTHGMAATVPELLAYVKINDDGTIVTGSSGIESITATATGNRTINFDPDYGDANYIAVNAQYVNNTAAIGYMFLTNVAASVQLLVRNLDTDALADFASSSAFFGNA